MRINPQYTQSVINPNSPYYNQPKQCIVPTPGQIFAQPQSFSQYTFAGTFLTLSFPSITQYVQVLSFGSSIIQPYLLLDPKRQYSSNSLTISQIYPSTMNDYTWY